MEVRRARRKTSEDRSLDLADVVEPTVDQCLAEIRGGLASTRSRLAHRNARQVADIQAPQIDRRVGRVEIASADVQWRRERVIAYVRRVVTGAARPLKRWIITSAEAARCH